jgi:bisdemethoxycurcumin synthase
LHLYPCTMMPLVVRNQFSSPVVAIHGLRRAQCVDGPATLLGIGTANLVNCMRQDDCTNYYFRVTKSEHLTNLKRIYT